LDVESKHFIPKKAPQAFDQRGWHYATGSALYFLVLGSEPLGARQPDLMHSSMVANGLKFVVAL